MPFPMVHLLIAREILRDAPDIANPGEFLLGSIAPDSVHFRAGYHSDMKRLSHLCVGEERWGQCTNNAEWLDSVLSFLARYKQTGNADFLYGYCAHIIADIQNNIKIWTPFRLAHEEELAAGAGSLLHREAAAVDYELYRTQWEGDPPWELLERARGVDLPGVVNLEDIDRMKHDLARQFAGRETGDLFAHQYVTVDGMQDFIAAESEYIRGKLTDPMR